MLGRIGWGFGIVLILAGGARGQGLNQKSGPWGLEQSGTTVGLRGVHSVGGGVAWASGGSGTVLRTEDGGYEWQSCAVPEGAEKLDFRGVWAWDANTAVVMSSGKGDESRLYRTTDGCAHWSLMLTNPDKDGYWDAMVFAGKEVGYLLGNPVKGAFPLLRTGDGGTTWSKVQSAGLTTGGLGIAPFSASNSALTDAGQVVNALLAGDDRLWFTTGGQGGTFVYEGQSSCTRDDDGTPDPSCLDKWTFKRQPLPMASGAPSAGAFSLRVVWWDEGVKAGVAVGGDFAKPDQSDGTAAWTPDGVKWTAANKPPHGYRSAVAWDADVNAWITVGTNGSDVSWDGGKSWHPLDDGKWNALSLPWVVGPEGRIGKIHMEELQRPEPGAVPVVMQKPAVTPENREATPTPGPAADPKANGPVPNPNSGS